MERIQWDALMEARLSEVVLSACRPWFPDDATIADLVRWSNDPLLLRGVDKPEAVRHPGGIVEYSTEMLEILGDVHPDITVEELWISACVRWSEAVLERICKTRDAEAPNQTWKMDFSHIPKWEMQSRIAEAVNELEDLSRNPATRQIAVDLAIRILLGEHYASWRKHPSREGWREK